MLLYSWLHTIALQRSFCDRVIVLKDGIIYKEVVKSNSRHKFLDELLEVLKEMGGAQDDN